MRAVLRPATWTQEWIRLCARTPLGDLVVAEHGRVPDAEDAEQLLQRRVGAEPALGLLVGEQALGGGAGSHMEP